MTKFILVGGYVRKAADGGKAFCDELVKGFDEPVKILDCFFAEPEERWQEKFLVDKEFFNKHLLSGQMEIRLAKKEDFLEQIRWADTIFLKGGGTKRLLEFLRKYPGWEKELSDKTVACTSAGANVIAKYYYGLHAFVPRDGFGVLPIKVIVHYRSDYNAPNIDWDKAEAELRAYKEDLPLVLLREGEFKVFEK